MTSNHEEVTSLHEPRFDAVDESYVLEALRSTWVSTGGPFIDRFERELAEFVGSKYAVSVVNGTVGLHLMLEVLKRQHGVAGPFEVLVPSLTFIATANAVISAGGVPVFVDTQPQSLNVDALAFLDKVKTHYQFDSNQKLWTSKKSSLPLLAIMPAHIMGWATDIRPLVSECASLSINLIEDAAEALGSRYADRTHVGTSSLASCFSFNGNKILTTGGGGMIVTHDADFAKLAKHLSTTAKSDGVRFIHDQPGYNYRMVNLLAALGCSQLKQLSGHIQKKAEIFSYYAKHLNTKKVKIYREDGILSNNWLVNIVAADFATKEKILGALNSQKIMARPLWVPCHSQPAMQNFVEPDAAEARFPHTTWMWERTVSLPSSPHLSDESLSRVCKIINSTLE